MTDIVEELGPLPKRLNADADFLEGVAEGNDDQRIVAALREAAQHLTAKDAEIEALRKEVERLTRERDIAIGERVARSKTMAKLRDRLSMIRLDDEIDRVYFRSTNDADDFRDLVQEIEEWKWHDIMRESQQSDPFEASRKAHERADKAEAENARMREALEPFRERALAIMPLVSDLPDSAEIDMLGEVPGKDEVYEVSPVTLGDLRRCAALQGDGL